MSYIVVSGESARSVSVDVVPETDEALMDAVAVAVWGSVEDARNDKCDAGVAVLTAELLEKEELSFEDGFVKLYRGHLSMVRTS